jgi:hypothetical protein
MFFQSIIGVVSKDDRSQSENVIQKFKPTSELGSPRPLHIDTHEAKIGPDEIHNQDVGKYANRLDINGTQASRFGSRLATSMPNIYDLEEQSMINPFENKNKVSTGNAFEIIHDETIAFDVEGNMLSKLDDSKSEKHKV